MVNSEEKQSQVEMHKQANTVNESNQMHLSHSVWQLKISDNERKQKTSICTYFVHTKWARRGRLDQTCVCVCV